ncbi:hypothetical protein fugu_016179 [Takifugu bimaculatus]|uniref:UBX domain-containing protein n=1 Tax=Takifugu bimaculatus TaxID=433685 RepID=A0A4Z2BXP9_9TELE|nr:hypothetical protein fugu_016179 [Takifugu bimaculatus]
MGFTEEQIQAAVQAGHFSVADATEWLLQGQYPRHRLVKQPSQPSETAFSAFNPPKHSQSTSGHTHSPSSDPSPVESRIKQDKSEFEEQERQRVTQEARAGETTEEKEDRKSQQEKLRTGAATETSPPCGEEQKLGGKVQTNVDNNCLLMIRLPSGESMRERFPADAPLSSVVEHIAGRHPSLSSFSLVQGFPRKRFGETELTCSLRSLGLTPNAALCIQTTPPETPQDAQSPADPLSAGGGAPSPCDVSPQPCIPVPEGAEGQEPMVPPPLPNQLWEEAVNYAGIPGAGRSLFGLSHFWGPGQRLVPGNVDEGAAVEEEQEEEPPDVLNGMPRLPFFPENWVRGEMEPRHHWPEQGNRLREAPEEDAVEVEDAGGPAAPVAAGLAAVERLQRAAAPRTPTYLPGTTLTPQKTLQDPQSAVVMCLGHARNPAANERCSSAPTAPSMQYSSSLAGLTPELVELLLNHMSRERLLRPRTLELFFGCPLQKFVLNCYPYSTNELLRQLRAFTALKHLSLVNSPLITDSGLSVLSSLVRLQYLNLASCSKLTDSCLQHITGLKSLCFLSLDQTKVTDAGMVLYLHSAPSCLSQLSLNQTAVTEATLVVLPSCAPQLRLLSIKQTKVRDVAALAGLSGLQTLNLDGTDVSESGLEHLASHPLLSSLSLAGISVVDGNQALQIISGLNLTQLTLPGRRSVTDGGLSFLSRLTLLTELDLTDYTQVTDQGVAQLASMRRLKKLSLSNTQVTDAGLPPLRGLQELQELCLDRTAVTSRGVADLITGLPHLQVLGLACTQVGDTVVRKGLLRCSQLVKLNLSRTRITDNGLKFLKRMHLAHVNLDGTGVSLAGVTDLLTLTNISSIRASNTRSIPLDEVSDEEWESQ